MQSSVAENNIFDQKYFMPSHFKNTLLWKSFQDNTCYKSPLYIQPKIKYITPPLISCNHTPNHKINEIIK
uniref:Uncharacterized protein n=1 Tax=Anguilla anguilla TaxID=7936 RepID=A0A0E9XIK4_ANGAN